MVLVLDPEGNDYGSIIKSGVDFVPNIKSGGEIT